MLYFAFFFFLLRNFNGCFMYFIIQQGIESGPLFPVVKVEKPNESSSHTKGLSVDDADSSVQAEKPQTSPRPGTSKEDDDDNEGYDE